jgi:hypothetical protein
VGIRGATAQNFSGFSLTRIENAGGLGAPSGNLQADAPPADDGSVVQVGDPAPQMAHAIAVEQYVYWQRLGWTHREMLAAVGSQYLPGTTGDDVFVEIVNAWNSLDRGE